jgi:hypothetical protein
LTLDNKLNKIKTYVSLISLTVFIVSLTQTALTYNDFDGQKIHSSLSLLFMGGLAILGGGLLEWFIWLANPLYVLALIFFFKSNKTSKVVSITATILALSFTTWKEILAAENGRTATIVSLNLGYWLWVLSLTILSIGTIYYFRQLDNNNDDRKNHSI